MNDPDLFDPPGAQTGKADELGREGLAKAEQHQARLIEQLIPIVHDLAQRLGEITMTDVRKEAIRLGVLTGYESGNVGSGFGSLMRKAGLTNTGRLRKSDLNSTHGRHQVIWTP